MNTKSPRKEAPSDGRPEATEIRSATVSDIPSIAKIIADNFDRTMPEHSSAVLKKFKSHCSAEILESQLKWKKVFVVCRNETVIGTGSLVNFGTPKQAKWNISNFFIAVEDHGKGYGAKLLNHLLTTANTQNVVTLYVPSSRTAIEFYRKFGFKEDAVQPPEDTADEITWMNRSKQGIHYLKGFISCNSTLLHAD